ncbi:hypothetical protein [Methanobrevibacter sp.]
MTENLAKAFLELPLKLKINAIITEKRIMETMNPKDQTKLEAMPSPVT